MEKFDKKAYYKAVNQRLNIDEIIMIKLMKTEDREFIPAKSKDLDAGYDCRARIENPIVLKPFERVKIPLGFAINVPADHVGDLRPRSGLMDKYGIVCGYGTIDAGYIDEVSATIFNFSKDDFVIEPKMRIAQLVIQPLTKSKHIEKESNLRLEAVDKLISGERGFGGHGSTGLN